MDPPTSIAALGSSFVIDEQGDIITKNHVVHGSASIRVSVDGGTYRATIVGGDQSTDVAVVRVEAPRSALLPLAFDDSEKLVVGDPVAARGNPFGLDPTMTSGIVSAFGRDIQLPNGLTIRDDPNRCRDRSRQLGRCAPRQVRARGGVDTHVETIEAAADFGFAVPSDTARSVAAQLIAHGHVEHARLGIGPR